MADVLCINNYASMDRFVRLRRSLEANGARVTVSDWRLASAHQFNRYDGVVLSGSYDMLSEPEIQEKYSSELEAIRETRVPLLGICYGHQLIGHAFGSRVVKGKPTLRYVETDLLVKDHLFSALPKKATLYESHYEIVQSLPEGFDLLARSGPSPVAAMKHKNLPLYGVQCHPERNSSQRPDGDTLVGNFVSSLA